MNNRFLADVGNNKIHILNSKTKVCSEISPLDFINLDIPGLKKGDSIIIEDAHLRSRENVSLAQPFTIEELISLKKKTSSKNVSILLFHQKKTPKVRVIASVALKRSDLLEKTDINDLKSIDYYLEKFPEVFLRLKKFDPCSLEEHEKKMEHIYRDRTNLTEHSNEARNNNYGIKTEYSDPIVEWIKRNLIHLASRLPDDTRSWANIEYNKKGTHLNEGLKNYTSDKIKFLYQVINTIIDPKTGEPRVRSDNGKPPYWKYVKSVYFGLTPYHMKAGVTASNYKWHKRKAGSSCKKSMNLESKKAIKDLDDVREIREAMTSSDKHLRTLWREVRKMFVEEGIR